MNNKENSNCSQKNQNVIVGGFNHKYFNNSENHLMMDQEHSEFLDSFDKEVRNEAIEGLVSFLKG